MNAAVLLFASALADPPEEPPDSSGLLERAKTAVAAMPGCFVMRGTAHDRWNAGIFGKGERTWALGGTLDNGRWDRFYSDWVSGTPTKEGELRGSLFGRMEKPEGRDDAGRRPLLAALEDDVAMEYVEREGEGWRLSRTLRGGDAARNLLVLKFDAELRPWSWAVRIVDPVRVTGDEGRGGKIKALDTELVADPSGAPRSERVVGSFARWPFAVDVDATTTWTHTPCVAAP